jgi:DNA replication regulator SLD2
MVSKKHDQRMKQHEEETKERLRADLKSWERAFENEQGHKPSPADVKANADISAKYKLYHKLFRAKSSLTRIENSKPKASYISVSTALKQVTPQKRSLDSDVLTPVKGVQVGNDVETVGPTPQLNGRMLGLFDGIQDQTPIPKRRKLNWGEQLAEARKGSPRKSSNPKSGVFSPK